MAPAVQVPREVKIKGCQDTSELDTVRVPAVGTAVTAYFAASVVGVRV